MKDFSIEFGYYKSVSGKTILNHPK